MKLKYIAAFVVVVALGLFFGSGTHKLFIDGDILESMPRNFVAEDVADPAHVATIDTGKLLGYPHELGGLRFTAVPYAAAPVGELRYLPPQPHTPWTGILDTRTPGPACIQATVFTGSEPTDQSEDCLWLSVSTPALDQAKRPVIVWVHGGGNHSGSNLDAAYDGAGLSARGDVVFVSLQYRLGSLGWMDVSRLGGSEVAASATHGLLDQIAGLEWVKRNIAQFGGDPDNVTLMGESAAAFDVATLLVNPDPAVSRLFHKVILQSGVFNAGVDLVTREQGLEAYLKLIGVNSLAELRGKSAEEIQAAETAMWDESEKIGTTDPWVFYVPTPNATRDLLERAAQQGKPILHGTTRDEYHLFLIFGDSLEDAQQVAYGTLKTVGFDRNAADQLFAFLQGVLPGRSEVDLYADVATYVIARYPHAILSEVYSPQAPMYTYLFDWKSTARPELGAFHALELPVLFGTYDAWSFAIDTDNNPPHKLTADMQDAWAAFARTGNPSHPGLPDWPAYDNQRKATMRLDNNSELVEDPFPWMPEFIALMESLDPSLQKTKQ